MSGRSSVFPHHRRHHRPNLLQQPHRLVWVISVLDGRPAELVYAMQFGCQLRCCDGDLVQAVLVWVVEIVGQCCGRHGNQVPLDLCVLRYALRNISQQSYQFTTHIRTAIPVCQCRRRAFSPIVDRHPATAVCCTNAHTYQEVAAVCYATPLVRNAAAFSLRPADRVANRR